MIRSYRPLKKQSEKGKLKSREFFALERECLRRKDGRLKLESGYILCECGSPKWYESAKCRACNTRINRENYRNSLLKRFRENTRIDGECVIWTGLLNKQGYGRININGNIEIASRASFELFNGPIPDGLCVCHKCDRPACIRPEHLFLGTHADMLSKGRNRAVYGAEHPRTKLSDDEVNLIRRRRLNGDRCDRLAKEFGVHPAHVSRICNSLRRSHTRPAWAAENRLIERRTGQ